MKRYFFPALLPLLLLYTACTKDSFITGKDAFIITSDTALHFDTVFATTGSITKQVKIFNINDQQLRISSIELAGGANSFFKMNVSGSPGASFGNIDIAANDSLYIFVTVNAPADNQPLPFFIQDSIRIAFNGNTQYIKLDAYGQNAHFLRSASITKDTTWTNDLPFVLLDSFSVSAGATLTIEKGVRVYCHANTPFYIEGSLQVNGGKDTTDRVVFANDRLDVSYKDQPATWEGLYFSPGSSNNVLTYAIIKNAKQGIAADNESKVALNQCSIDNCAGAGIITYNGTIKAVNCLISNCGSNIYLTGGGNYTFTQCTVAAYSTLYFFHQYPALFISNGSSGGSATNGLNTLFQNCIIWGDDNVGDEIAIDKQGADPFRVAFENTLYKSGAENPRAVYKDCLQQTDPLFNIADAEKNIFDFHLQVTSPCIDAGTPAGVINDLDGNTRSSEPDIGCYESP